MTTFDEDMRAWLATGAALLDNVSDGTVDGPDVCNCGAIPGDHTEDECVGICTRCGYAPDNTREVVNNLCRDCNHELDYEPGHAPRLMGQRS